MLKENKFGKSVEVKVEIVVSMFVPQQDSVLDTGFRSRRCRSE